MMLFQTSFFLSKIIFKRMMNNKKTFYKTFIFLLRKINCHCNLWKIFGLSIQFYIYVLKLSSHLKNNFLIKYYLNWWRKQNKYILCQNWEIIYLQQVLIYGCPRGSMIFLLVWLTFKDMIRSLNKWLLSCLKQQKLLVEP
jgi:hypothetical protein